MRGGSDFTLKKNVLVALTVYCFYIRGQELVWDVGVMGERLVPITCLHYMLLLSFYILILCNVNQTEQIVVKNHQKACRNNGLFTV